MSQLSSALQRFNQLLGGLNAAYHDAAVRLGLSDSVLDILYAVCAQGGSRCPLREVCRMSALSKQTVNSALRQLERRGLLRLEPVDGRCKDVCLTPSGRALAQGTAGRLIRAENAVFARWTPEERERYLALTEKYLLDFRAQLPELTGGEEAPV